MMHMRIFWRLPLSINCESIVVKSTISHVKKCRSGLQAVRFVIRHVWARVQNGTDVGQTRSETCPSKPEILARLNLTKDENLST